MQYNSKVRKPKEIVQWQRENSVQIYNIVDLIQATIVKDPGDKTLLYQEDNQSYCLQMMK